MRGTYALLYLQRSLEAIPRSFVPSISAMQAAHLTYPTYALRGNRFIFYATNLHNEMQGQVRSVTDKDV